VIDVVAALAIVIVLIIGLRWLLKADPKVVARWLRYAAVGGLGLLAVFLAISGRGILDVPIGGLMVFLLRHWIARGLPGLDRMKAWLSGTQQAAGSSTIETAWLRMALDRSSGDLDGEVLQGRYRGARLSQLTMEQICDLLAECQPGDAQSARLIETYLDRVHGGWRDRRDSAGQGSGPSGGGASGRMTQEEAWQVLGLKPGAGPDEIREAHRRLMIKLHPDHGGSNYLASKINAARDTLLGA